MIFNRNKDVPATSSLQNVQTQALIVLVQPNLNRKIVQPSHMLHFH